VAVDGLRQAERVRRVVARHVELADVDRRAVDRGERTPQMSMYWPAVTVASVTRIEMLVAVTLRLTAVDARMAAASSVIVAAPSAPTAVESTCPPRWRRRCRRRRR
jgi:hypothetical protein